MLFVDVIHDGVGIISASCSATRKSEVPLRLFIVDAFADEAFSGNPAAVCLVEGVMSGQQMQAIAAEVNLSDTAFVRETSAGRELRWFTPTVEVDLCGHATLAAAHVLWNECRVPRTLDIEFQSKSGLLTCSSDGKFIELDFPAMPLQPVAPPTGLFEALGVESALTGRSKFDLLVRVESEKIVRSLEPDFVRLSSISTRGIIVTSVSDRSEFDFVSRFFAPAAGINEDPVTGSAHCCLAPYWSAHLCKAQMTGYQASPRGGTVRVTVAGDRVILGGRAVTVVRGELVATGTDDVFTS